MLLKNTRGDFVPHQTANSKPLLFASYRSKSMFSRTGQLFYSLKD